jgi:hypothetical protein
MEGESGEQRSEDETKQSAEQSSPQGAVVQLPQPPQRENATQPPRNKPKKRCWRDKRWRHPQVIVNGALAFVAVIAAIIYFCQLQQMKKATRAATNAAARAKDSIDQARQTAHLDQRAWVAITEIAGVPTEGQPFTVTVTATNTGRTFAKKFQMTTYTLNLPSGLEPTFESDDTDWTTGSIDVLAPNAAKRTNKNVIGTRENPDKVTADKLKYWKSTTTLFVAGKLIYEDIFGCQHWTTFCAYLETDLTWVYYRNHNDADNNCGPPSPSPRASP